MPVRWTPESHEALLAAIVGSGVLPSWGGDRTKAIISAWPKTSGSAPTASALIQHLDGLRKKYGVPTAAAKSRDAGTIPSPARPAPVVGSRDRKLGASNKTQAIIELDESSGDDGDIAKVQEAKPEDETSAYSQSPNNRKTRLPRATLSPSTGLKEKRESNRKRRHDDHDSLTEVKTETFLELSPRSVVHDNDRDLWLDFPTKDGLKTKRQRQQEDLRKFRYQSVVIEDADDEY